MKRLDGRLQRLFEAAAQAPEETPGPLPFAVEAGVLGRWRSAPVEDDFARLAVVFRRAVICAGLIMVLSIVWNRRETASPAASAVALANYEINAHLPP